MSILLAILAAIGWGVADFLARIAGEKIESRSTIFFVQLGSAALLLGLLVVTPGSAPSPWPRWAMAYALSAAALNGVAMTLFYEALRRGPVSLVSPIASSFAGITTVLALLSGERASLPQLVGIGAILLGIAVSTAGGHPSSETRSGTRGVVLASLVALTWGAAFFLITPAFGALGRIVPVLFCRCILVLAHGAYAIGARRSFVWTRAALPAVVGIVVLDTAAFLAYGASLEGGTTSVSVVITSLFSVVTVLLAALVLRERLHKTQWAAVAIVLVGIALAVRP